MLCRRCVARPEILPTMSPGLKMTHANALLSLCGKTSLGFRAKPWAHFLPIGLQGCAFACVILIRNGHRRPLTWLLLKDLKKNPPI